MFKYWMIEIDSQITIRQYTLCDNSQKTVWRYHHLRFRTLSDWQVSSNMLLDEFNPIIFSVSLLSGYLSWLIFKMATKRTTSDNGTENGMLLQLMRIILNYIELLTSFTYKTQYWNLYTYIFVCVWNIKFQFSQRI